MTILACLVKNSTGIWALGKSEQINLSKYSCMPLTIKVNEYLMSSRQKNNSDRNDRFEYLNDITDISFVPYAVNSLAAARIFYLLYYSIIQF